MWQLPLALYLCRARQVSLLCVVLTGRPNSIVSSLCPCCAPLTRPFIIVRVIRVAKTLSRSPDMVGKASPASACKVCVGQGGADGTKRRRVGGACAAPPPALVGSQPGSELLRGFLDVSRSVRPRATQQQPQQQGWPADKPFTGGV